MSTPSLAPPVALRARGLRKRFGERTAVDGVDLDLHAGEILALLGPNGAGKTTLMHLLVGVLARDEGAIDVAGAGDPRSPRARRSIGIAPQAIALYPDLTAEENLAFFARLHGLSGHALAASVEAALALAALEPRRRDRAGTFSGGMQRRLNLAAATLHAPRVLLLDEPTAGVDPQSRAHLYAAVEALARGGTAVVLSTHHMEEAARLADRVAIYDHGRVRALGTVSALLDAHAPGGTLEQAFLAVTGEELRD